MGTKFEKNLNEIAEIYLGNKCSIRALSKTKHYLQR